MSHLANRALQLEAQGLPVLPLVNHLKAPEQYTGGYKQLLPLEMAGKRAAEWTKLDSEATGGFVRLESLPEGNVVLDLDFVESKHHLEFAALVGLDLGAVHRVKTPSGGLHLYLRYPTTPNLPTQATVTFSDGVVGPLDIRCRGKRTAIVMPGSTARSKTTGEVGLYEALGEGTEDDIFNLQWTECTDEQQQKLEDCIGLSVAPSVTASGEGERLACEAFGELIATGVSQLTKGEFDTNDTATWLGNVCGAALRTDGMPSAVIEDCWSVLLSKCLPDVREQFERHPRHKKSFIENGIKSLELSQMKMRAKIAEAMNPKTARVEDAFEKEVLAFFGGAVGVILDSAGKGTFGLLRGAEHARLHEQDWDDPDIQKVERDPMFGGAVGISWITALLIDLQMQGKQVPQGMEKRLSDWLVKNCIADESGFLKELRDLQGLVRGFDRHEWLRRLDRLPECQKSRWLWHLAPTLNGVRSRPYVALVDQEVLIAIPPACNLSPQMKALLGDPVGSRTNKKGKKIFLYAIPEEAQSDEADQPV